MIGRLEELVLANSGEDEFEEIYKLLIAKLYAEMNADTAPTFSGAGTPDKVAERVNQLLARAADRWSGILPARPRISLTDDHLAVCVRALQDFALLDTSLEVLDSFFEYLVTRSAKGAKGQFFTPRHVIDCCVRMVDPRPGEFIVDPACGSGGFLIHALNHMRELPGVERCPQYAERLWGFDFDQRAVRVAKALMLLAGHQSSNIIRLNSLLTAAANKSLFSQDAARDDPRMTIEDVMRTRSRNFKGFDVIVTNPPFAGEVQEQHLLEHYELAKKGRRVERDVLFIERCVQLLRPGGRFCIVLPQNKVGAETSASLRQWLLQRTQVVSVLGLARATFLPHTHQKTSVVFGIKRHSPVRLPRSEPILFAVSEKAGKDSRGQTVLRPGAGPDLPAWDRADHDLGAVVERFRDFMDGSGIHWGAL